MEKGIRQYLSQIGQKGGRVSKRQLNSATAKNMVRIREAGRLYRKFHSECFWSYDIAYKITLEDIPWVVEQLKKHGNRQAWEAGMKLCR